MDGVDAALASFEGDKIEVIAQRTKSYPAHIGAILRELIQPGAEITMDQLGRLHIELGQLFAGAVIELLDAVGCKRADVAAIGSHGQTIRHSPDTDPAYSLQLGDPATIATRCGITTVADFRSLDIAAGGQGAPLVPAFHAVYCREPQSNTVVINIGGIANITFLGCEAGDNIIGFDTGPGNCLLDEWNARHHQGPFDDRGSWAATGQVVSKLLDTLLNDRYIKSAYPKSTGREYFNLQWLNDVLARENLADAKPQDVQATLAEFTATSIVTGIQQCGHRVAQQYVCGGGAHNDFLMRRLTRLQPDSRVQTTAAVGIDPDAVEALAFAWLARQRMASEPVRLATTAKPVSRILGAIYAPTHRSDC